MAYKKLFDTLWEDYSRRNPSAQKIHDLFTQRGENVVNDHIAFRTINNPLIGVDKLGEFFKKYGYEEKGSYDFPVKKLFAKHYEHEDPTAPKVFISELLLGKFSPTVQGALNTCVKQIPKETLQSEELLNAGTLWNPLSYETYKKLLAESEYAAWIYVFGFCANHFTVNVNNLKTFDSLTDVNLYLKEHKFKLNNSGGEIKGDPAEFLEQSSTLADHISVNFNEGTFSIPSCYYEFAKRYKMPDGKLYNGFVAASADKIFESTDVKNNK